MTPRTKCCAQGRFCNQVSVFLLAGNRIEFDFSYSKLNSLKCFFSNTDSLLHFVIYIYLSLFIYAYIIIAILVYEVFLTYNFK